MRIQKGITRYLIEKKKKKILIEIYTSIILNPHTNKFTLLLCLKAKGNKINCEFFSFPQFFFRDLSFI